MVLSAVFVPMAFFGGTTGAIYRQFSITIVSAMVLSVLVAMILTPALCATLLKTDSKRARSMVKKGSSAGLTALSTAAPAAMKLSWAKFSIARCAGFLIYVLLLGGMVLLFLHLPTSFLPLEDRGMFTTSIQLPSGSTQQQTLKVVQKAEDYFLNNEKSNVESVFCYRRLRPRRQRPERRTYVCPPERLGSARPKKTGSSFAIIERATKAFNKIKEARVFLPAAHRPSAALAAPRASIWSSKTTPVTVTRR